MSKPAANGRRAVAVSRPALIESLENRKLLSAVSLSAGGTLYVEGTRRADDVVVRRNPANRGQIEVRGDGTSELISGRVRRIVVVSGAGDDSVLVDRRVAPPCTLMGGDGDDSLYGGSGDDSVEGDLGDDSCLGGAGDDSIRGGDGVDSIEGSDGDDSCYGDSGRDRVRGDRGDDDYDNVREVEDDDDNDRHRRGRGGDDDRDDDDDDNSGPGSGGGSNNRGGDDSGRDHPEDDGTDDTNDDHGGLRQLLA